MAIISVSSVTVYVQSGSDITGCNMMCLNDDVSLELYRQCGGEDEMMLEYQCYYNVTKPHDPRIRLNTQSGCWKLTSARKNDSCVYTIKRQTTISAHPNSSTEIRVLVLDPVLISNITSNSSRLGEDMSVSVQFSGEDGAVTWKVDGEPLPERYRLIDDNRTLIIPSVQRDDAERTFRVTITNPVSNDTEDYKLINPIFSKMQEAEDPGSVHGRSRSHIVIAGLPVGLMIICIVCQLYRKKRDEKSNADPEDVQLAETGSVLPNQNGFIPSNGDPEDGLLAETGSVLPNQNGFIPSNGDPEDVLLAETGSVLPIQNGSIPSNGSHEAVQLSETGSVPSMQNGFIPSNGSHEAVQLSETGSVLPLHNGSIPSNGVL